MPCSYFGLEHAEDCEEATSCWSGEKEGELEGWSRDSNPEGEGERDCVKLVREDFSPGGGRDGQFPFKDGVLGVVSPGISRSKSLNASGDTSYT